MELEFMELKFHAKRHYRMKKKRKYSYETIKLKKNLHGTRVHGA